MLGAPLPLTKTVRRAYRAVMHRLTYRSHLARLAALTLTLGCLHCAEPTTPELPAGGGDVDGATCSRLPAAADRTRKVLISHPNDDTGDNANDWEVLELTTAGVLRATGTRITMGRRIDGAVPFTPDGRVAIAAQHDGTLGVVRFNDSGGVTVVHEGATGAFYAEQVVISPDGETAWIVDPSFPVDGGGIYRMSIGCDGTLTDEELLLTTKLATTLLLVPDQPDRAVILAREVDGSTAGHDVHLVELTPTPRYLAGADLFPDDEHLITTATISTDGRYAIAADGSPWSDVPHRLGVVELVGDTLQPTQTISPLPYESPAGLAFSPYGNSMLLLTAEAFSDALTVFSYDPTDSVTPFDYAGEVSYGAGDPELPAGVAVIERGALTGRALIAEVLGVRQVQFLANGSVADGSFYSTGSGYQAIVGAVGVAP